MATREATATPAPRTAPVPLRKKRVRLDDALFHAGLLAAVAVALGVLAWLLVSIVVSGAGALDLGFLSDKTSSSASRAGFNSALRGSVVLMSFTLAVAVPLGFASAIYLEKIAPHGNADVRARLETRIGALRAAHAAGGPGTPEGAGYRARLALLRTRLFWGRIQPAVNRVIEINISNLAAVPSIVYGLLGLAVFIGIIGMDKSLLAGGLTLGLLVLPIVIIASREALRAVPSSIEQGAMALGATRWEAVSRQVVPAAFPGMLTGTILAMSRAIGETAPLVVVGGVAFATAVPSLNPVAAADTPLFAMPLQIFFWAGDARADFRELAAAGIIVLLGALLVMNAVAIFLRNRFSRRW